MVNLAQGLVPLWLLLKSVVLLRWLPACPNQGTRVNILGPNWVLSKTEQWSVLEKPNSEEKPLNHHGSHDLFLYSVIILWQWSRGENIIRGVYCKLYCSNFWESSVLQEDHLSVFVSLSLKFEWTSISHVWGFSCCSASCDVESGRQRHGSYFMAV